ncbi:MAG TPA: hypothetical protein VKT78_03240 [Fimbriimonadaceae bacterium]|nr:hypothetical protein [Fimbriimonadaceae bacterium]
MVTVATVLVIPLLAVLDRPKHPPDLGVSYQSALFPPTLNVDVLNKSRAPISELHLWAVETPPKGAPASFVPGRFEVELRGLVSDQFNVRMLPPLKRATYEGKGPEFLIEHFEARGVVDGVSRTLVVRGLEPERPDTDQTLDD